MSLQPDGCYKSCAQFCAPGQCSPKTCDNTKCYEKGCKVEKERICKIKCSGTGNCWSRCSECCYKGTKKCEPQPCAAVCWAPHCTRLAGSIIGPDEPRPTRHMPAPTAKPSPKRCGWGCKGGGKRGCYKKCMKFRNSNGVCKISNVCNRRCYRRGCGLGIISPVHKKCK